MVKKIYVYTTKNVIINIAPHIHLPRSYGRFCGLMIKLLLNLSIPKKIDTDYYMRIIKGLINRYLPIYSKIITFLFYSHNFPHLNDLVWFIYGKKTIIFIAGVFFQIKIEFSNMDEIISMSISQLCILFCISRITNTFEIIWDIK